MFCVHFISSQTASFRVAMVLFHFKRQSNIFQNYQKQPPSGTLRTLTKTYLYLTALADMRTHTQLKPLTFGLTDI